MDLCDRCGAQAYVRVLLPKSGELLFCAHHGREHAKALSKVAVDIQDETGRLTDGQPKTLDEIGKVYGVTRERIRQIESKTLSKLRHPSRSQKLRDFLE